MIAHARTTDPSTSHEAAASLTNLRESQQAVFEAFVERGPMDDTALVKFYQNNTMSFFWPEQSASGIRTRRSELAVRGLLKDTGERVKLPSGRKAITWALS